MTISPATPATNAATQASQPVQTPRLGSNSKDPLQAAKETKQAFTDFVGKSFYAQMLKSMRQTVGKPAYFDGGRGEEVFRSQLDQTIADEMSQANGHNLADGMFKQQFPKEAELLRQHEQAASSQAGGGLDQLAALRRL